jgi:NAD(P)-dependent dehydrogenase (short-subunit alcohol dehydrogenase family)
MRFNRRHKLFRRYRDLSSSALSLHSLAGCARDLRPQYLKAFCSASPHRFERNDRHASTTAPGLPAIGVVKRRKTGGRADAIATDLAAADGASKLAKHAHSIIGDRLDILVANAGVSKAATIEETTVEDFDRLFAVNVRAPFFLVQQLLPIMSKGSSWRRTFALC